MGDIVHEVESLVSDGVVEVTLLGQNVNSYGRDLDGTPMFSKLLYALNDVAGLKRVRFTSPHPKDFRADSVRAMAECEVVCEHIHLPVQSGSDRLLKRMKRAYTQERYLEKVRMVRRAIPEVAITTDIIVGFPGETEADFEQTLAVVAEVRFDGAYTFQYSPRPMTAAAGMADHLPKEVVQERYDRLLELQEEIGVERNARHLGATEELLVEGSSRKDPERLTGRTRTNKLVHFPNDGSAEGTFRSVKITATRPHYLEGEVTVQGAATAAPRSRLSLPLMAAASSGCSTCS